MDNSTDKKIESTEEKAQVKQGDKLTGGLYDLVSVVVSAVAVIFVVFTFCMRVLVVSGGSMLPTLHHGDSVAVSSAKHSFDYGDIVIVAQPNEMHKVLIKRVIAVGGQTVDIDPILGTVYIDGKAIDEKYILEPTYTKEDMEGPVRVPEGYVFVMGDNRNDSTDSRSEKVGIIDERYIMGKVMFRVMPVGQWDVYENFDAE